MQNGGVIVWQQRLLVYSRTATGWQAQFLGDDQSLAVTGELATAIDDDQRHQLQKRIDEGSD